YVTKGKRSTPEEVVPGEGMVFYGEEDVSIALNEGRMSKHAWVKCRVRVRNENGEFETKLIETVAGRLIFNQYVPEEVGFVNELLTKKKLQQIIAEVVKICGIARTAQFLDDIKELGFQMAYAGGRSIGVTDVINTEEKDALTAKAKEDVDQVWNNYHMGLITDNERYNQVIDIWTSTNSNLTNILMKQMEEDKQGFNAIYMM